MEHPGGRSGTGRTSSRSLPRPIRGGRATSSSPSVGRGIGYSPELPPFSFVSSPSVDSIRGGRGVHGSPTYSQREAEQHTSSPHSQVGDASSSDTPVWGTVDPATGKIWMCPVGSTEFLPQKMVKKFIGEQIFRNFNQPWPSWKEIPRENRDAWLNEFLEAFSWLPEHWENIRKAYNFKGSKLLCDKLYKLRNERGRKNWIQPEVAEQLFQRWANDDKFKEQSERNKSNRAHMDGPSYVGGSISFSEHRRKIVESGEVPAEMVPWATFERTHSQEIEGGGKRWINAKSQQFAETYQQLTQERDSQIENDPASSYSDNEGLFIKAAGGFDKRGRVFGMGASASELRPYAKRSSSGRGAPADDKRVKALEEKVKEQEEKVKEQERKMKEQGDMLNEMRALVQSLMKDKGTRTPGGDDDTGGGDDDQHAAV